MNKTAQWISAGVVLFATNLAVAGPPAAELKADWGDCDPCATICDPCCPPKAAKVKAVCPTPQKVIVHQSQPIIEFRNDAPAPAAVSTRRVIEDRAIRPVGDFFHHGQGGDCGCNGGNLFKSKTKNYYQGVGGFGGFGGSAMPQATMLTAMPMQVQAYVPTTVQTVSMATVPTFATSNFVGPSFAASGFGAPFGASAFNFAPQGTFGASNFNVDATTLAMAQAFFAAANAQANGSQSTANVRSQSNGNGNGSVAAASASSVLNLEAKVNDIDERLKRVERKLNALCNAP
jgi:hypothetical protein